MGGWANGGFVCVFPLFARFISGRGLHIGAFNVLFRWFVAGERFGAVWVMGRG